MAIRTMMPDSERRLAEWLSFSGPAAHVVPDAADERERFAADVIDAGLSGLILERQRTGLIELHAETVQRLQSHAMAVAADNLNRMNQLEGVLRSFNKSGIPVMLLKGAALLFETYDRPDLRPMSDVDLLVRPGDVPRTLDLLAEVGCRRAFDLLREDFFPKYHYESAFVTRSPRPLRIDLHARPFRPLYLSRIIPDDATWDGARTVSIGGATAFVPKAEVMVVHLAAHAAFHGCARLLWLVDIKRFAETCGSGLDWDRLVEVCEAWRLSLAVDRAMRCTEEVLGACRPTHITDRLRRSRSRWQDRLALAASPHEASSALLHVGSNLLCTPGIAFRLKYLSALLRPDRRHLAEVYPLRHPGWQLCAQAWRFPRAVFRLAGSRRPGENART